MDDGPMAPGEVSLFLAGNSVITRPWSHVPDESFLRLIEVVRAADASVTNLETVIHEFNGFAQADCGGSYMTSPPRIAAELKWAGFDMVAHANNHCFDYGSTGILETINHVESAGLVLAGSGRDLQNARAPRYVRRKGRVVALVAMATDFIPYGKASYARSDVAGRPGLNPLRVSGGKPAIIVTERMRRRLEPLARIGLRLRTGNHFGIRWGFKIDPDHLEGNLKAISEAASKADIVVASVHAHRQGPWLQKIARHSIERGASLVFIHGPHEIRGIEIFNGRPVFYAMSDLVFLSPNTSRNFPPKLMKSGGLRQMRCSTKRPRAKLASPLLRNRKSFEAFAALIGFTEQEVARIGLIPLDLQFDAIGESRGRPQLASPQLGREIIGRLATRSKRFGTRIVYDADSNRGQVAMG